MKFSFFPIRRKIQKEIKKENQNKKEKTEKEIKKENTETQNAIILEHIMICEHSELYFVY